MAPNPLDALIASSQSIGIGPLLIGFAPMQDID